MTKTNILFINGIADDRNANISIFSNRHKEEKSILTSKVKLIINAAETMLIKRSVL